MSIADLKTKIKNANALGVTNLTKKGVEISESATTYEIMKAISEIVGGSGGGGIQYTDIVYNADNTITLTDKDGVEHTISCTYEGGKLVGVAYDGKAVELTYAGDVLVKVGKTDIDVANTPVNSATLDHTVTFTVDGEPYEVVSVKDGNSVNAPLNNPISDSGSFDDWQIEGNYIDFPYTPTNDVEIVAKFSSLPERLYNHFSVNQVEYPYIFAFYNGTYIYIYFATTYSIGNKIKVTGLYQYYRCTIQNSNDVNEMVDVLCTCTPGLSATEYNNTVSSKFTYYANFDMSSFAPYIHI